MRVAAATPSPASLRAAFATAAEGGSAVDAAVAAALTAMVQEIGICSPGGGGFLTVGGRAPSITYDGYVAVPGLGRAPTAPVSETTVSMDYGGGVTTIIGPGSIATPGIWRALEAAHRDHGRLDWERVLAPAIHAARDGFTLGAASRTYLADAHRLVFGIDPAVEALLHDRDGALVGPEAKIRMPDLAATLEAIADGGVDELHSGGLGRRIAADLGRRGSRLTALDLARYQAERRQPVELEIGGYRLSTNPQPAVGGAALAAVLERLPVHPSAQDHVEAQAEVYDMRRRGDPLRAGSTIHVSVVDESGLACALTASSGYGSGVVPTGTGLMMNNALGELELLGGGRVPVPGERMVSNMAPSVAASPAGDILAIGSPGANRITSALAQVISAFVLGGRDLAAAVAAPRLHVETGDRPFVALEPGAGPVDTPQPVRLFESRHMFFGGVGVARRTPEGDLMAVADPRREGAAGVFQPASH